MVNYHNTYALPLEVLFRGVFHCDMNGVGGLVRAGNFEYRPISTSMMLLCKHIVGSNEDSELFDKLEVFMFKYGEFMEKSMSELGEEKVKELIIDIRNII